MRAVLAAACASAAAAATAAAPATAAWAVKLSGGGPLSVSGGSATRSSAPHLNSLTALRHVYNHLVGVAAPSGYDATKRRPEDGWHSKMDAGSSMPGSSPFERPVATLFVTMDGLAELVPAVAGASFAVSDADAPLRAALERGPARRGGLAPSSLSVLHPTAPDVPARVGGPALRYTAEAGFVLAGAAGAPAGLLGHVACSAAGGAALAKLGWVSAGRGTGSCARYRYDGPAGASALAGHLSEPAAPSWAHPVEGTILDAGAHGAATAQVLSEAALLVMIADAAAARLSSRASAHPAEREVGAILHRIYLSGAAAVAAQAGPRSPAMAAAHTLYATAAAYAEGVIAAAGAEAGVPVATVLLSLAAQPQHTADASVPQARFLAAGGEGGNLGLDSDAAAAAGASSARRLSVVANGTSYYTQNDIADSQLFLWTWVGLLFIFIATVAFITSAGGNMDPALLADMSSAGAHHRAT